MHSAKALAFALFAVSVTAIPTADVFNKRGSNDEGCFGDYSGNWSSQQDGSGSYVTSADDYKYGDGNHCWTDLFDTSYLNQPAISGYVRRRCGAGGIVSTLWSKDLGLSDFIKLTTAYCNQKNSGQ